MIYTYRKYCNTSNVYVIKMASEILYPLMRGFILVLNEAAIFNNYACVTSSYLITN